MMYLLLVKNVSLILIFFIGLMTPAYAQTKAKKKKPVVDRPAVTTIKKGSVEAAVIEKGDRIAKEIDTTAEKIDLFFAGRKFTKKKNETRLMISYFGNKTEYVDFKDEFKADINLRLPNTEEEWSLMFTTQDDQEYQSLENQRPGAPPRPTRYGVSAGLLKKLGDFDVNFRPGIKIKDPIETSHIISLRNSVKWGVWHFHPRIQLFADSKQGTGQSVSFGIERDLTPRWALTFTNEEKYLDFGNIFSTLHGPGVLYRETDRISYSAKLTAYSTNEKEKEFHLQNWNLAFSRRQEFWKKLLYYSLSPSWTFDKYNNFKHVFDMAVQVDLVF